MMKLTIAKSDILATLTLVAGVVEKKQTLPILFNLLFRLSEKGLTVVGTDMAVEISQTIESVKGEEQKLTLSCEKILDIVRALPENADITISQDGDKVQVTSGRSRYMLKTLNAEEFPMIEPDNWEERFKIKHATLKELLVKTSFAMALNDVRYYLNGLLLQLSKGCLRAVATDGHRLAQSEVTVEWEGAEDRELIVPRKAITEITRFLGESNDSELTVEISHKYLKVSRDDSSLLTTLVDGKFPEFKGVLDNKPDVIINVDRVSFIQTMSRAAVLAANTDRFRGVKTKFADNLLQISGKNIEQEEAVDEMNIEYAGEPIEIGYNVDYLLDAANASQSKELVLNLQSGEGVCTIKEPEDDRTTWLVMPMRI